VAKHRTHLPTRHAVGILSQKNSRTFFGGTGHDGQKEKGFVMGGGRRDNARIAFSNLSRQPQALASFIISHLCLRCSKSAMVLFGPNRPYL
jgi:hypothetical protein